MLDKIKRRCCLKHAYNMFGQNMSDLSGNAMQCPVYAHVHLVVQSCAGLQLWSRNPSNPVHASVSHATSKLDARHDLQCFSHADAWFFAKAELSIFWCCIQYCPLQKMPARHASRQCYMSHAWLYATNHALDVSDAACMLCAHDTFGLHFDLLRSTVWSLCSKCKKSVLASSCLQSRAPLQSDCSDRWPMALSLHWVSESLLYWLLSIQGCHHLALLVVKKPYTCTAKTRMLCRAVTQCQIKVSCSVKLSVLCRAVTQAHAQSYSSARAVPGSARSPVVGPL